MRTNISLDFLGEKILSSAIPQGMETKIVAIDGCGGAGKTTLSNRLSSVLGDCTVIHTDDFASWDIPINWYKRMIEQVLEPLKVNRATKYQRYDWGLREMAEWVEVKPGGIIILEGVSSSRKEFREYLSFSIFVKTSRAERLRRGLERDGESALEQWEKWMEEEYEYVERDRPEQFANIVIDGEIELVSV